MGYLIKNSREKAQYAFKCVKKIWEESGTGEGEWVYKYKSHVKDLPAMILQNGLDNALAFIYSKTSGKGDDVRAYREILKHLRIWLFENGDLDNTREVDEDSKNISFITEIISEKENYVYRRYMEEILSLLGWLKRFSGGMIEKKR